MGATNRTPRGLSQFLDNDKPTWRGDYNADMLRIDEKFDAVGYDPLDFGAVGDGVTDDTAAVQAAIDAAHAAGGGRVIIYRRYGWKGDLIHRGGVTVEGVSTSRFLVTEDVEGRGLVALDGTARYRYGLWATPNSEDDNPGQLKNIIINGNNVGGAGAQLVLMESVNGVLDTVHIIKSAGDALEIGGSQNGIIDKCYIGDSPAGVALSVFHRSGQGAGSMKISNCYISTSKWLLVSDQDPTNFWPHDIFVDRCLFENYTEGNDIVELKSGDFQFDNCVFTYSLTGNPPPNDCLVYVHQPTDTAVGTRANFNNCYFNGGGNPLDYCVKIKSEGYGNFVNFIGTQQIGNCEYVVCYDGGFNSYVTYRGSLVVSSGTVKWWTAINGGFIPGITNLESLPTRWVIPAEASGLLIGDPIQIRNDNDTTDRFRVDSNGSIRWLDGTDPNTAQGSIARDIASNNIVYGGATELGNAFILRSYAFLVNAVDFPIEISAEGTANPHYVIAFTAPYLSAVVTLDDGPSIGSQLQIAIAGGSSLVEATCSITWSANVKFAEEDPQPNSSTKVVSLFWDGTEWVETSRSGKISQIESNRAKLVQETMARDLCTGEEATVSGYMLLTYFTAYKDAPVTALRDYVGGTAQDGTATLCRMGLFTVADNGDLNLVAATPNDPTLWTAAYTMASKDLSATYNVKKGHRYAVGKLVVTGGAMPMWAVQHTSVMLSSQNPRMNGLVGGGLADLPANVAAAAVGNNSVRFYTELVG